MYVFSNQICLRMFTSCVCFLTKFVLPCLHYVCVFQPNMSDNVYLHVSQQSWKNWPISEQVMCRDRPTPTTLEQARVNTQEKSSCKWGLEVRMTREEMVMARKKTRRRSLSITMATCFHSSSCCSLLSDSKHRTSFLSIVEETFWSTRRNLGSRLSTTKKEKNL